MPLVQVQVCLASTAGAEGTGFGSWPLHSMVASSASAPTSSLAQLGAWGLLCSPSSAHQLGRPSAGSGHHLPPPQKEGEDEAHGMPPVLPGTYTSPPYTWGL